MGEEVQEISGVGKPCTVCAGMIGLSHRWGQCGKCGRFWHQACAQKHVCFGPELAESALTKFLQDSKGESQMVRGKRRDGEIGVAAEKSATGAAAKGGTPAQTGCTTEDMATLRKLRKKVRAAEIALADAKQRSKEAGEALGTAQADLNAEIDEIIGGENLFTNGGRSGKGGAIVGAAGQDDNHE